MYYALTDTFTGDDPSEYSSGFANTKEALAFRTRAQRDDWVRSTRLLTAKAITYKEAMKLTSWEKGDYYGKPHYLVKPVPIYDKEQKRSVNYHILTSK